jgi:monofunctional biosynthetic peptidoglycan transglycosylase
MSTPRRKVPIARRVLRWALVLLVLLPLALAFFYRYVPPPLTPLMVIRLVEGDGLDRAWVDLEDLPAHVPLAVMAAEDNRFCRHVGFDPVEIGKAIGEWRRGKGLRGASTLSMQVTRNLFLWPGGGWPRKALEALWTPLVELVLGKRRIMELYLNIAETGRGTFGFAAAAEAQFGKPVTGLTAMEAAHLAAVLPDPRGRRANPPSAYIRQQGRTIRMRMRDIRPLMDCLELPID